MYRTEKKVISVEREQDLSDLSDCFLRRVLTRPYSLTERQDLINITFFGMCKGNFLPDLLIDRVPGALQQVPEEDDLLLGKGLPFGPEALLYRLLLPSRPFFRA